MTDNERQGRILKCVGGFYTVEAAGVLYECRARGAFRNSGVSPVAGDTAVIEVLPDGTGSLTGIGERRNCLVRPPVANLDLLAVVASVAEPNPSTLVIDKMVAIAEMNRIEPIVVISKADLLDTAWLESIYRRAGLDVFSVSARSGEGVASLRKRLFGKLSAFTGNSGVGKSSILNAIDSRFSQQTGEISRKLGRGRHTTRSAELHPLSGGGYVVDTAGFSSVDLERTQRIYKEDLPYCFREFVPLLGSCRYTSCTHTVETGCAVIAAVERGEIATERHESYRAIYQEIKDLRIWNT